MSKNFQSSLLLYRFQNNRLSSHFFVSYMLSSWSWQCHSTTPHLISIGVYCSLICQLTELANLILEGTLPGDVNKIICCANLMALKKRDGDIRPIAVEHTLRRLAVKCMNTHAVTLWLSTLLTPIQLGLGVSGSKCNPSLDHLEADERCSGQTAFCQCLQHSFQGFTPGSGCKR